MSSITYNFGDSLEEIRSRLVWRLSFFLIGFGVAATWYVLVRRDLPFAGASIPFFFTVFVRVVQLMLNKDPVQARYVFVWGMVAHLIAALLVFSDPWLPYVAIPCVFIIAMLMSNGGPISAAIFVAVTGLLNLAGIRSYQLFELTVVLTFAASSSWLSAYTLFTVVHWYSAMQVRNQQLLETTRDHRAELSQALKSLQLAYETQKHIQLELIWARKHAEDARRLKEQFAANISHELWTPLNLILGFSEVMYLSPDVYGDMDWTPSLRRDIHQIYRNSQHLLGLVGDILDLSRFEMTGFNITPEPISLAPFLKDTLEIFDHSIRGRAIRLNLTVPADLPTVEIDGTRIRQVILNLLNNACRYTEAGIIEVAAHQVEQEVVISVRDTGSGIAADKLSYLFDEFYQVNPSVKRSHSGAGLGLAISKRFVEAHSGRIWVESEEGVGSCFSFALPVSERWFEMQHAYLNRRRAALVDTSHRSVLVLEAESGAISLLQHSLKDCEVIQVRDARYLPEMILTHHPKMIIRNTRSGQQQMMSQPLIDTGVPVIECTLPTDARIAKELGIRACLTKPVDSQTLLDEIDQIGTVQNILIAFSDRSFALLVERMLETSEKVFEVRRVYDYEQGISALVNHPPDLVLLDSVTPDTEGLRLIRYMRAHPKLEALPVIVLISNSSLGETRCENHFVVHQRDGLYPIEVLKFINAVFEEVRPRYYTDVATNIESPHAMSPTHN